MRFFPALSVAVGLPFAGAAHAQPDWQDPSEFGRLAEQVCLDGAAIPEKAERMALIERSFGMSPGGEDGPDAPDLVSPEGISAAWEPQYEPDIFCVLTAPLDFYEAEDIAALADQLNGSGSTPEAAPGVFGPFARTLSDGRTLQLAVISDPADGLLVVGMIED
ncbi:hypothetical protein DZD18_11490 [Rhodobacteraceae bacterium W635]|nr:hypothetical protein DZD18_11490 [Rhodobacteraceae bacterium W635]